MVQSETSVPKWRSGFKMGRAIARSDVSGTNVGTNFPFGQTVEASIGGRGSSFEAATPTTKLFTGKERDANTKLDFFGARFLSSAQGRFTSPDAPFADQSVGDPQSWNMYSYVRNNPLIFVDPSGNACAVNTETGKEEDDGNPGQTCAQARETNNSVTVSTGNVSPVQVGFEWATGTGPDARTFTAEDRFTQMLRQHKHINMVVSAIQQQLSSCQTPTPLSLAEAGVNPNYSLSGVAGILKYVGDYSTLMTGGATGNLAVTYLGSYSVGFAVNSVNRSSGTERRLY